jgi:tRNA1(Val) A37 N6-methylase TrmN6
MNNPPPEISKPFYAVRSEASPAELKKQKQAEIERMIEAKVAQALRCLRP